MKFRGLLLRRKAMTKLDSILKSRDIALTKKILYSQSYGFSSSHIWMWELDHKESWAPKNWFFWTVCCRRLLRVHWTERRSNYSILKEISPEYLFIGRADAEAETPKFWPPEGKSGFIRKGPDAGKDWRQEEKGMTEDEMIGWHHWLSGHEFEQSPGDGEGQGSVACCSPWGCKELNTSK